MVYSVFAFFDLGDIKAPQTSADISSEEYVEIVCEQLRYLRPEIVINRITGDPKASDLIEPQWLVKKFCVLNDIDKYMAKNDFYQGDKIKKQ